MDQNHVSRLGTLGLQPQLVNSSELRINSDFTITEDSGVYCLLGFGEKLFEAQVFNWVIIELHTRLHLAQERRQLDKLWQRYREEHGVLTLVP